MRAARKRCGAHHGLAGVSVGQEKQVESSTKRAARSDELFEDEPLNACISRSTTTHALALNAYRTAHSAFRDCSELPPKRRGGPSLTGTLQTLLASSVNMSLDLADFDPLGDKTELRDASNGSVSPRAPTDTNEALTDGYAPSGRTRLSLLGRSSWHLSSAKRPHLAGAFTLT